MGKMMLHILMVFAEMERETIQKRIADNYYARGEKGFYLGGPPPFGYDKEPVYIDGKKTYAYKINPEKSKFVEYAYIQHTKNNMSLNAIARHFNENKIPTSRRSTWTGETIGKLLINPAHVKADADVYNFFKSLKVTLNNPIEDYVGKNGCLFYGNRSKTAGDKFEKYQQQYATIGLHEGIIDSELWLNTQFKFKQRSGHTNLGDGVSSWVQGLVRCESCKTSMYVKNCKNKTKIKRRYFYCRKKLTGVCEVSKKMIGVSFLESVIADGTETVTNFINKIIEKLSEERDIINSKLLTIELQERKTDKQFTISEIIENWHTFDIPTKKQIAKNSIKEINVNGFDIDVVFFIKKTLPTATFLGKTDAQLVFLIQFRLK